MRRLVLLLLALLPVAAVPLVGSWVLLISAVLLFLLVVRLGDGWRQRLVLAAGAAGGIVGVVNASAALLAVGVEPVYSERAGFGWAALLLAVLAAAGGPVAALRPRLGGVLMLLAGLAGAVAINLFFINTFYVLALIGWLIGAFLAFLPSGEQVARGHAMPD